MPASSISLAAAQWQYQRRHGGRHIGAVAARGKQHHGSSVTAASMALAKNHQQHGIRQCSMRSVSK